MLLLIEFGNIWVMLGFLHIAVQKKKTCNGKGKGIIKSVLKQL